MKLSVFQNNTNFTLKMDNFSAPFKEIDLATGEIYLGYFKPIKNVYFEIAERDEGDKLKVEYWDGSSWVAVTYLEDRTFGLSESGFVYWGELPQKETTYSGQKAYWLRVTTETPAPVSISAINLVLSWDEDFGFVPGIFAYLAPESSSFIVFHQEARNRIIQTIRNSGKKIRGHDNLLSKSVDQFDLLDIDEFKQASKYMALHLIFDDIKKSSDDQYAVKSAGYLESYELSLNDRLMTVDENNNGKTDESENQAIQSVRIIRE